MEAVTKKDTVLPNLVQGGYQILVLECYQIWVHHKRKSTKENNKRKLYANFSISTKHTQTKKKSLIRLRSGKS